MTKRLATVVISAILLADCGASSRKAPLASTPPSTAAATAVPTTVDLASFGQRYMTAVAEGNTAADAFQTAAAKLPDNATGADIAKIADPLVAAYQKTDRHLLGIDWPASVRSDVDALVKADAGIEGVLATASAQTAFSLGQWIQQFGAAGAQAAAAANIVRRDLGLPLRT